MNYLNYIVTTTRKPQNVQIDMAKNLSLRVGAEYVPRGNSSINKLLKNKGAFGALVVAKKELYFTTSREKFFFHPSIAKVRIKALKAGKTDQMIKAMDLKRGNRVLDCTLGLGADAIVASYVTGPEGLVVGLEVVPVVYEVVKHGMSTYQGGGRSVEEAVRRIKILNREYSKYLQELPAESFDVIYFDPMFRVPRKKSAAIMPLRILADPSPLSKKAVEEAVRVAKKRVVMKERRKNYEFARLGFNKVVGGKNSPVTYGIIEKRDIK